MTKEKRYLKAKKHLEYARENLEFWREKYVEAKRDKNPIMDIYMSMLGDRTVRQQKIDEAIAEINEAKAKIAKFERIVK